jgi:cellulose biosynthesis protein BcsQ
MPCILIFTAGAKGGSGKTTAARFLITYLQEKGTSPLILDLDDENHTHHRGRSEGWHRP